MNRRHARAVVGAVLIVVGAFVVTRRVKPAVDLQGPPGWPQSLAVPNGGTIVIYRPQVMYWTDQTTMTMSAAASYRRDDGRMPEFGTIVVEGDTTVLRDDHLVHLSHPVVVDVNFPTLPTADVAEIALDVERMLPPGIRTVPLGEAVAASAPAAPASAARALNRQAPPIFVDTRPAAVIRVDGPPEWAPVPTTTLEYAINTDWDLFRDRVSGIYYVRDDRRWLAAGSELGPWTRVAQLPASFERLPADQRWDDARAALAPQPELPERTLFISQTPTELILFDGAPTYRHVRGTRTLLWVNNTDADVFREGTSGTVYYLTAGRWFSSPNFSGPWTFATDRLPADFRRIPPDHPRSRVLAAVPGTPLAAQAIALAQIPDRARVSRRGVAAPPVVYDGAPRFEPIDGTPLMRAVNTVRDVLAIDRQYFLCADGVWFVSSAPAGPWTVAVAIPPAIGDIPPTSPAYHLRFATVESNDPDWTIFAAAPGYHGTFVDAGVVVRGTGYVYRPYTGGTANAPVYIARTSTYGADRPAASARTYDSWDPRLVQTAERAAETVLARGERNGSAAVGTSGQLPSADAARREPTDTYAGRDGRVYRRTADGWERLERSAWVAVTRASPNDAPILERLDRDAEARQLTPPAPGRPQEE